MACRCTYCETETVAPIQQDPPGAEVWQCLRCGEVKRWCPDCNHGWVTRAVVNRTGRSLYVCDECDATWLELAQVGAAEAVTFETYLRRQGIESPWDEVTFVHDFEPTPTDE